MDATQVPIVCILSNPRSGSTAFRRALAVGGAMKDFGEVFHDDRSLTQLPFLDFLERWRSPLLAMLDWSECGEISRAYMRQLRFASYGLQPLIDIKHNAWNALRPLWQFPHDEPVFLSALKEERAFFVQLKRENLADQVISYVIAMNTHIWHAKVTSAEVPENLAGKRLDPQLIKRLCGLFTEAEALTERFLYGYKRHLTLTYEDIFSDETLGRETARRVSEAIGSEIKPVPFPLQRNSVLKREVVSNYDELCEIAMEVKAAHVTIAARRQSASPG